MTLRRLPYHERFGDGQIYEPPYGLAAEEYDDGETEMSNFKQYRRSQIAELRPYEPGETLFAVSISGPDRSAGSPKKGDMIARNPKTHADQWLVAAQYFADNFEPV